MNRQAFMAAVAQETVRRPERIGFHNGRRVIGAGGGGAVPRRRCNRLSHPTFPSGPQISGTSSSREPTIKHNGASASGT